MKSRFVFSVGTSLMAGAFLLSSCSGSSGNGPSSPRPTATTIPGAPTPTPDPAAPTPTPGATNPTPTPTTPVSLRGQIGFVSTRGGNADIYAMDSQGGVQRALSEVNSDGDERSPSISRDGTIIVWSSNRPNRAASSNFEIYIRRPHGLGGQNVEAYTNDSDGFAPDDTEPTISPDGTKIAWTTTRGGNRNIAVMNITGSNQRVLTLANEGEDSQPAWTSDSQNIAFYSVRAGARGVYIMDASGNNQRALVVGDSSSTVRYLNPTFSPNGQLLAVAAQTESGSTIALRNSDGTPASTIFNAGNGLSVRSNPKFGPNSNTLIYTGSNGAGNQQIYTANLDGTGERALTSQGQNFDARFSN